MNKDFKVLFLTNNANTKELSDWLALRCEVVLVQEKMDLEMIKAIAPDVVVSFNYRYIIRQDVIDYVVEKYGKEKVKNSCQQSPTGGGNCGAMDGSLVGELCASGHSPINLRNLQSISG